MNTCIKKKPIMVEKPATAQEMVAIIYGRLTRNEMSFSEAVEKLGNWKKQKEEK
jgi:hypothetical protein